MKPEGGSSWLKASSITSSRKLLYEEYASTFRRASRSEGTVIQEDNFYLKRLVKRYFPSDHGLTIGGSRMRERQLSESPFANWL